MRTVVVLAGGLGTRVAHLTGPDLPKILLPVAGRPFIDWKLANLAAQGTDEVVLLLGHGADAVVAYLVDAPRFGMRVRHVVEGPELLGTGGAIRAALGELPDPFWVTYGDTLLELPVDRAQVTFEQRGLAVGMTVLENADRWERSNVDVKNGFVVAYDKNAPPGSYRFIDYGMLFLRHSAFAAIEEVPPLSLDALLKALIAQRQVAAFPVTERFYDIGTEHSYQETDRMLRSSKPWARRVLGIETQAHTPS